MGDQATTIHIKFALIPARLIRPLSVGQPRLHFDEKAITKLGHTIGRHTQQQACRVFELKPGEDKEGRQYELIWGECRWRSQLKRNGKVRCDIVPRPTPAEAHTMALLENFHRTNLSPYELALALAKEKEMRKLNDSQLAAHLSLEQTMVNAYLRLSRLDRDVLELMHPARPKPQQLRMGVALILERYGKEEQKRLGPMVVGMPIWKAEGVIRKEVRGAAKARSKPRRPSDMQRSLQRFRSHAHGDIRRFLELPRNEFATGIVGIPSTAVRDYLRTLDKMIADAQKLRERIAKERGIEEEAPASLRAAS